MAQRGTATGTSASRNLVKHYQHAVKTLPAFALMPAISRSTTRPVTLSSDAVAVLLEPLPDLIDLTGQVHKEFPGRDLSRLMEDPYEFLQRVSDGARQKAIDSGLAAKAQTDPDAAWQMFSDEMRAEEAAVESVTNDEIEQAFGHDPDVTLNPVGGRAVDGIAQLLVRVADAIGTALNDTVGAFNTLTTDTLPPFVNDQFTRVSALVSLAKPAGASL